MKLRLLLLAGVCLLDSYHALHISARDGWEDALSGEAVQEKTDEKPKKAPEPPTLSAAELIEQNFQKNVLKNKVDSMKEELSLFSRTLEPEHLEAAKSMRAELEEDKHPQDELVINTKDLYEQGFQFDSVAHYDNVQNLLSEL